ncbi:carboxypeptidase-like regulatory domain-containing protein [Pedobacter sp. SYSU D00535]|uniref:carboxypeptidase-like regulatory domain-containing protein n=1 Tax=Pedobacter sp. SYSU D00535 TaxID=2810308 RepID=UPI001A97CA5B|nr:TonB-dependent receptor plug domain-containing protein [Pedobacter sp. SYSU D00535]
MKQRYILVLFALLCSAFSFAFISNDEDPLKVLLAKLKQYQEKNPQEKIHIHTDKPYYAIGDSIWLKAYIVNSERNQLSALSKIVYVDLINEKDSIKKSLRLPVVAGLAAGDFVLSDSLAEGNYRIRAYTQWMRNFGEEFFFDKTIQVGNVFSHQLITDVKYAFSKTGIKENVVATANYRDINGKPVANKEVSYNVQLDFRNIASGKGTTDENGNLQIKFTNAQPFVLKSGKINTTITLDPQTKVAKSFPVKATSAEADVQLFPEGGNLVNNLRSKVAFKAVGADGLGKSVTGYVIDKDNNKLGDFKSEHAGMGVFTILPAKGNSYTAVVRFADGSEKKVPLPRAENEGYVLSVSVSDPDSLGIKVSTSPGLKDAGEIVLVAQTNGIIQYTSRNKLDNTTLSAKLPRKRFPTGILQLTLFSSNYRPVAERLVFINKNDFLDINLETNKQSFKEREKVTINLLAKTPEGRPTVGNFSVSVLNETLVPFDDTEATTILSNLLLTSDLKGHIENPNYYFLDINEEKRKALDHLMLTQGWRRYTWNSIISNSYLETVYTPEQSITVSGKVTHSNNGKPVIGGKVTLLASSGNAGALDTVTNAEGRFRFENLSFNDSTRFVIQARNTKGKKNVDIEVDHVPPQLVTKNKNAAELEVNVNQSILPYLKAKNEELISMRKNGLLRRNIMLQEVKIVKKKPVVTHSSNLNGAGNADAILRADQLRNCLNLSQCLQGMVAGLVIQNGIAYLTRSMYSSFSGLVPMQLIVDGTYVDPTFLGIIPPTDVETIEVLKSGGNTAIYGIRGGGGVLIINTKRGERNLSYRNYAPGIAAYTPQGFYAARQFYSPVYGTPAASSRIPDLRKTIYWAPNITTDSSGKASFDFYTADAPGTYKVVLEGLNLEGKLGRKVYRFQVE